MPDSSTLILFSRLPFSGKVKSRLAPILSPDERGILQEAMLLDLAEKLARLGNPIVFAYSDEWVGEPDGETKRDAYIEKVAQACSGASPFSTLAQEGATLGERMGNAMQAVFDQGAPSCLLMGSDLPVIVHSDIQIAEHALSYSDVVFAPSADGGYWLVGMRTPLPQAFDETQQGGKSVLTKAVAACRAHDRTVALSRETFDVDTPEDYFLLCKQVSQGDFRLGSRTVDVVRNRIAVSATAPHSLPDD